MVFVVVVGMLRMLVLFYFLKHLQGFRRRRDRVAPEMGKRWRLLLCFLVKSRGGAEPRR
jgi:hypothetical protein